MAPRNVAGDDSAEDDEGEQQLHQQTTQQNDVVSHSKKKRRKKKKNKVNADEVAIAAVDDLSSDRGVLDAAFRAFWMSDYVKADQILADYDGTQNSPTLSAYYAELQMFKAVIDETPAIAAECLRRNAHAYELASALVPSQGWIESAVSLFSGSSKRSPAQLFDSLVSAAICGEALLWDGIVHARAHNFVQVGWCFRKSWNSFKSASAMLDSWRALSQEEQTTAAADGAARLTWTIHDIMSSVNWAVGWVHFAVSIAPPFMQAVLEVLGIEPDRRLALEEISRSIAENGIRARLASLTQSWLQAFYFGDYEQGAAIVSEHLALFPSSCFHQYLAAYICRFQGNFAESDSLFQAAFKSGSQFEQFTVFVRYEFGHNLFLQLRWPDAKEHLQFFIDRTHGLGLKAYACFQLACCHAFASSQTGDAEHVIATELMERTLTFVRKGYAYDTYADVHARRFLKQDGFTPFERQHQVAYLCYVACNFQHCLDQLAVLESMVEGKAAAQDVGPSPRKKKEKKLAAPTRKGDAEVEQLQCDFLRAGCLIGLRQLSHAESLINKILQSEAKFKSHDCKYIFPNCYTLLGELALHARDAPTARSHLVQASHYKNYEFENLLSWRIRRGLDLAQDADALASSTSAVISGTTIPNH